MSFEWFSLRLVAALSLCAGLLPNPAHGQVNLWTNTVSGKWEAASNWSAGTPSSGQSIFITNGFSGKAIGVDIFTVFSNAVNGCMRVTNVTISGPGIFNNTLFLNNAGVATQLHVRNTMTLAAGGSLIVSNSWLRIGEGATGGQLLVNTTGSGNSAVNVFGSIVDIGLGSSTGGTLSVGAAGSATMHVASSTVNLGFNGSFLLGNGGIGSARITNSTFHTFRLNVDSGTLTIDAGATISMSNEFTIGRSGTTGTVWVSGGSVVMAGGFSLSIGNTGPGNMIFSNGTLQTFGVTVGNQFDSPSTLTVLGGTMAASGLGVGGASAGSVWMSGGQLTTTNGAIGSTFSSGQVVLSNGTWLVGNLTVGAINVGTLSIAGGTNVVTSRFVVSEFPSTGTVWLTSGELVTTNALSTIGAIGVGHVILSNGSWLAHNIDLGTNVTARGTLTVAGGTLNILSGSGTLAELNVGRNANATSTVWLTGGQIIATNSGIVVGRSGIGFMTVSNGTMSVSSARIGRFGGSAGTMTIAGGVSSVYSNLTIGDCASNATGRLTIGAGDLFVTNATGTAVLDIRNGSLLLSGGSLKVDTLVMTNPCGLFIPVAGTLVFSSLMLAANLDADGDGLPNAWEQSNGLDPLNPNGNDGSSADVDGDGFDNMQEYLAGTDPHNSGSALRIISILRQGDDIRVRWTTAGGKTNAVQATSGVVDSFATNFTDLAIFPIGGSGDKTNTYIDPDGALGTPARYYRVRVVP